MFFFWILPTGKNNILFPYVTDLKMLEKTNSDSVYSSHRFHTITTSIIPSPNKGAKKNKKPPAYSCSEVNCYTLKKQEETILNSCSSTNGNVRTVANSRMSDFFFDC